MEGEGVQWQYVFEDTSVLTLAQWIVRRAEEHSVIIKLRTTKCGGLSTYTTLPATNLLVALIDHETK